MADANSPQVAVPAALKTTSSATLSFPGNIENAAYYTRLTFKKYNRNRSTDKATTQVTATIILPIPENFSDAQEPVWYGDKLGLWGSSLNELSAAAETAKNTGNSIYDQYMNGDAKGAFTNAAKFAGIVAAVISPASMRDGKAQNRASQQLGMVVNPHLSLMFDGMALRNHELTWKCSPRTAQEAKQLGFILATIRDRSLPSYNQQVSKFALDYPDTVEAEFVNINKDFKTKIFKSAISNFRSNLGPSGIAFYPEGVPVEVEFSVSLVETEIVTREDFTGQGV